MTMIPPSEIPAIPPRSSRSAMRFSFQCGVPPRDSMDPEHADDALLRHRPPSIRCLTPRSTASVFAATAFRPML
jgi:hypothetical protein